jgi:hypothetical protein|tara:strand:+ start:553 stop:834 length:282 start_codon:yes stop_codon:yes gene_type:complete
VKRNRHTTDRDFEIDTEYCELRGTVTLDITDDITEVISVGFEGNGVHILHALEDFVKEAICQDDNYDARTLRIEEQEWDASERAEERRQEEKE